MEELTKGLVAVVSLPITKWSVLIIVKRANATLPMPDLLGITVNIITT